MLATEKQVAPATHRQALNALLFLHRQLLGMELPWRPVARPARWMRWHLRTEGQVFKTWEKDCCGPTRDTQLSPKLTFTVASTLNPRFLAQA